MLETLSFTELPSKKMNVIIPVILAGGTGTRLWPLSRESYPKQFLNFGKNVSLLQATWLRVAEVVNRDPIIVTNEEYRFIVSQQMKEIGITPSALILEPFRRDTAPAVAVAALKAQESGEDPILLVLPSDHEIRDAEPFIEAIKIASTTAALGKLITFGVVASRPETGYGYIKSSGGAGVQQVERFVEKPDLERAKEYIRDGSFLWNSGIFLFKASEYLRELQRFHPEIVSTCREALDNSAYDLDFIRLEKLSFDRCPALSVDYAVMEKTENAAVLSIDAGWSDLGSWDTLCETWESDSGGNVVSENVISWECTNTLVLADSRLLVTAGLDNILVIDSPDALLVAHKNRSQQIKQVVEKLKSANVSEAFDHAKVYRPWGTYELISKGDGFIVKKISVKPGGSLSMQKHLHRSEHWVVVRGVAHVTIDGHQTVLVANKSTYIPQGIRHRLANNTDQVLELIEIQSGNHLSEDDIIRFDDCYGRTTGEPQ